MTPELQALGLLTSYCTEFLEEEWKLRPSEYATGHAILQADPQVQIAVIRAALCHIARYNGFDLLVDESTDQAILQADTQFQDVLNRAMHSYKRDKFDDILIQLYKRKLPYTLEDIHAMLQALNNGFSHLPAQALLRALASPLANAEILAACRSELEPLRATANWWLQYRTAERRKFLNLLDDILSSQQERPFIIHSDDWGAHALVLFEEMEPCLRERWLALLHHCSIANGNSPASSWLIQMQQLVEQLDKETFCRLATEWIGAFGSKQGSRLNEENADLLKSLAWCCADIEDAVLASTLADAAIEGYRKIAGVGPRSAKIAGACVYTLKSMPGLHGVTQLERVLLNVKQPAYRESLRKALNAATHGAGVLELKQRFLC